MSTRLCPLDELVDETARRFDVDGHAIAVVRIGDDVYALDDICSHAEVSLSEGEVDPEECTLECPKHGSAFRLDDGTPVSLPATRPVASYPVTIVGGFVEVAVEVDLP